MDHGNAIHPIIERLQKYSIYQRLRLFYSDTLVWYHGNQGYIGKKNWVLINSQKGAKASAIDYSIAESAKLNNLRPYKYFKYLLTELPNRMDSKGNTDPATLDDLMSWAEEIPEVCRKRR